MNTVCIGITILSFHRCGFVDYPSVEEAKHVFDNPEDITMDGNVLFINFARPREGEFCSTTAPTVRGVSLNFHEIHMIRENLIRELQYLR